MAQLLTSKARYGNTDPTEFLNLRALFGDDLPRSKRFVDSVGKTLKSLYRKGARATVDAFLSQGEL